MLRTQDISVFAPCPSTRSTRPMNENERNEILQRRARATEMVLRETQLWQASPFPSPRPRPSPSPLLLPPSESTHLSAACHPTCMPPTPTHPASRLPIHADRTTSMSKRRHASVAAHRPRARR